MALAHFLDFVELRFLDQRLMRLWVIDLLTIFVKHVVFALLRGHGYHSVVFDGFVTKFFTVGAIGRKAELR